MKGETGYTVHGMRIRTRRQRKGWRQEDLAKATGLQTGTISRIETGYHPNTQLRTIGAIAGVLGCSVDDLLTWNIPLDWEAS